jgi:hypothetical protein
MASMLDDMIFGRKGGPISTSMAALQRPQVVRPRWCGGDQRCWHFVGAGHTSKLPSDLGGDAWRSPAIGGGDTRVLDCFFIFLGRVFFVRLEALSSNIRFFVRVMHKGFYVNCTRHVWL